MKRKKKKKNFEDFFIKTSVFDKYSKACIDSYTAKDIKGLKIFHKRLLKKLK